MPDGVQDGFSSIDEELLECLVESEEDEEALHFADVGLLEQCCDAVLSRLRVECFAAKAYGPKIW
jgi:hypothetical protein